MRSRLLGFEFGAFGPLRVRHERVPLGRGRPVRLLYASDLHLGHWWTADVPAQLLDAARAAHPDVLLLGGDLVDRRGALPVLHKLVESLTTVSPVAAIPGNHDAQVGLAEVRKTVQAAGAGWLPDEPLREPIGVDAAPSPRSQACVLCAHYPSVFPTAVAAGYRLVLAGHLHGSQFVLATYRDRIYPAVWVDRWHCLRFHMGDALLLVSRGAADTLPFRFNCPREVLLCDLC
jgi:predicted MPP superfamily phosphohydrolase